MTGTLRAFVSAFVAVWVFAFAVGTIIEGAFTVPAVLSLGVLWLVAPRT